MNHSQSVSVCWGLLMVVVMVVPDGGGGLLQKCEGFERMQLRHNDRRGSL